MRKEYEENRGQIGEPEKKVRKWEKRKAIYEFNSSQLDFKNYDFCEFNVQFGAISWKFDILSITA